MKAANRVEGRAYPLGRANIDTDVIIPAAHLKTITRAGLGRHAFETIRADAGNVFEDPRFTGAPILIAGDNFACGSSREHAPWALLDYGFRAVVSTSIADIFTSNALKNGLLPIVVSQAVWDDLAAHPDQPVTIDLEAQTIRRGNAEPTPFRVESFARQCLLDGVDAMGWLTARLPDIEAFERRQQETA